MRFLVVSILAMALVACGGDKTSQGGDTPTKTPDAKATTKTPETAAADAPKGKSLLVTQTLFKADDKGLYTKPDKASLLILSPGAKRWKVQRIDDSEANVFHKAIQYGAEGILTIAQPAALKLWNKKDDKWTAETLWKPTFGGKLDRLRDFELGDFNGDGKDDLAIATHDQGVVAVIWRKGEKWEAQEIDRQDNFWVHESEVGDLDGDGKLEIYATPSQPNTASGKDQGGKIIRFAWTGEKFERSEVVSLETRHMKEILVADVDGDGKQELYAAVEAETDNAMTIKNPVEIRRFDYRDGKFEETMVTTLNDRYCRFLVAGDVDNDGKTELVAAAFSAGVWVIKHDAGVYTPNCIDPKSGGFEHAAYIADVEGDGKNELYVADDKGGVIRRYDFEGGQYKNKVLNRRPVPSQAMVWNITTADL